MQSVLTFSKFIKVTVISDLIVPPHCAAYNYCASSVNSYFCLLKNMPALGLIECSGQVKGAVNGVYIRAPILSHSKSH